MFITTVKMPFRAARCLVAACLVAAPVAAAAQAYPTKPIRLAVGSTPGGGTDVAARLISPKLSEILGRQVVVENRPGATTTIAVDYVVKSPADGYSLLMGVSSLAINPHILKNIPYDALRDLAPVSQVLVAPNIMVAHPSLPVRGVKDFIAFAKPRPGQINIAAGGAGSSQHLAIELFIYMTGAKIVHIPYKGQGAALIDVVAGHVSLMMANVISALPHVRNGRLRAMGVTGPKRVSVAPDVPTIAEAGVPGYEVLQWYGVLAPAGTPREIIGRLHAAVVQTVQDPKIRERIIGDAGEPVGNTPEEFTAILHADYKKWGDVIRKAGIRVDQR